MKILDRENIGIILLMLLNIGFTYLLVVQATLYYGFLHVPLGKESINEATKLTSYDSTLIIGITILSIIAFLINYIILKKMILSKKSFLIGCIIIFIGISISIPFSLPARESFLHYKSGKMKLQDYLSEKMISEVQLIDHSKTIQVKGIDDFMEDIGGTQYRRGMWKYAKKTRIMLRYTDGSLDSIYANGSLFDYKGKIFFADKNIIEKYLTE
ncbi:hypothetical protein Fleli_3946 [Bernardetia litoralis DSM 6794]|uniref:Uncharacterized protein n=1 Tax=Bernardetia litoralis (strain ATCC 23117 / DSM 6794 / NBRC 15988 / NCIMB 1366 / Fx l1 / Sio-4) TaxID=880071 RepID=I4AQL3_BERLS|nr:hypothetical protein [Bernardetia litoralis]AFM06248.1 hypothetical protein Fleli_3946 [Bernardetia litoralis DSM 6794]